MVYNYTLPTNVTNFPELGTYLGNVTDGFFGPLMLMAAWFIMFISFTSGGWRTEVSLLAASWISFLLGALMWLMGWMDFLIVVLMFVATMALTIFAPREKD